MSEMAWLRQLTGPGNGVRVKARGCCPFVTSAGGTVFREQDRQTFLLSQR
jgi:hypothetical protein